MQQLRLCLAQTKRFFTGRLNPRDVIQTYIEADEPAAIEELHRDLALHMHNSYRENREGLEQLAVFFQVASGLLTIEVVLWIIAIPSTA
jgi:hypothetical protein